MEKIDVIDTFEFCLLWITFSIAFFDIFTTILFVELDHIYEVNPFIENILLHYGISGFIIIKTVAIFSIILLISLLIDVNKKLMAMERMNFLNMCYGICFSIISGNIVVGLRNIMVWSGTPTILDGYDPMFLLAVVVTVPIFIGLGSDFISYIGHQNN